MTIDEIKQALHKVDLTLRPWIVFASPSDAKAIKETLPSIEEKVIIQETEAIESGKVIVIERERLEAWTLLPKPYAERRQNREQCEICEEMPPAEPEHTMEEFMYGQDPGSLEDGSL